MGDWRDPGDKTKDEEEVKSAERNTRGHKSAGNGSRQPLGWKDPVLPGLPSQGDGPDADVGKRETIGPGTTMGMKGGKWREKERGTSTIPAAFYRSH